MVVHRQKKVRKYRGSTTHGGGSRKKRRGSGSRGGRGRAGSGKRAGHKKYHFTLGTEGFLPRREEQNRRGINVAFFTLEKLEQLVNLGKVKKQGEYYLVDLATLGYAKLLSTGEAQAKLKITAEACSAAAKGKVEAAGGEVIVPGAEKKVKNSNQKTTKKNTGKEE